MIISAEIKIDDTGILEQMEAVKKAGDVYENEILKLRGMLLRANATTTGNEKTEGRAKQ